jgi:thiol-disulfide isomerase/thioredoxin
MTPKNRLALLPLALALCASALATPPPAKSVLAEAENRGRLEHKKVLVLFHASWCHWCHEIQKVMDEPDIKPIFDQNFEVVWLTVLESDDKKADENQGGEDVLASMGGTNQGIPFFGVLDTDGKTISTSMEPQANKPAQNIGCPSEPNERAYFGQMLKAGAPSLTDAQLAAIDKAFADRAAERTVEGNRLKHLGELQKAKDFDGTLKEVDSLTAQYPAWAADNKSSLDGYKLRGLLHTNPDKAYVLATKAKGTPAELNFGMILTAETGLEKRFYDYAVDVLTASYDSGKKAKGKSPYVGALAKANYLAGNPAKAVELEQENIANVKEMLAARTDVKQETKDKILGELEKKLKEYQEATSKK